VSPVPHLWIAADIPEYCGVRNVVVACVTCPGGAGVVPPPSVSQVHRTITSPQGCVTLSGAFCTVPGSPSAKRVSGPWSSNCTPPPWWPNRPGTFGTDQSLPLLTSSQDCASSGIDVHLVRLGDSLPGRIFPLPNRKMFLRLSMMTCYSFQLSCSSLQPLVLGRSVRISSQNGHVNSWTSPIKL
jgi:hypothetical protein